jgi:hypothetical protein
LFPFACLHFFLTRVPVFALGAENNGQHTTPYASTFDPFLSGCCLKLFLTVVSTEGEDHYSNPSVVVLQHVGRHSSTVIFACWFTLSVAEALDHPVVAVRFAQM